MKPLTPLAEIHVPPPRPDERYQLRIFGRDLEFLGLKRLLAAADVGKAGDRNAGLAAADDVEREAARQILAGLTLQHLYERPLVDDSGRVDAVMCVNYDIDRKILEQIAPLTVGALKNRLLATASDEVVRIGAGLTGVMAAAVAKLCDVHELIAIARKIVRPSQGARVSVCRARFPHVCSLIIRPTILAALPCCVTRASRWAAATR